MAEILAPKVLEFQGSPGCSMHQCQRQNPRPSAKKHGTDDSSAGSPHWPWSPTPLSAKRNLALPSMIPAPLNVYNGLQQLGRKKSCWTPEHVFRFTEGLLPQCQKFNYIAPMHHFPKSSHTYRAIYPEGAIPCPVLRSGRRLLEIRGPPYTKE